MAGIPLPPKGWLVFPKKTAGLPPTLAGYPVVWAGDVYDDLSFGKPQGGEMKQVKAGQPLIDLVKLCYKANAPVLLTGPHGIGKSQILEQAAQELGVGFICRDLSLMEPPDLVGLPRLDGGVTKYLPPAFLPTGGKGLLVFEELNRCAAYMRSPCLQLLTARCLNDYVLPQGWLPVAAINPPGGEYDVQELDPALLSRFVKVDVVPDRKEWLGWAKENKLDERVVNYVQRDARIFEDTCPRDWAGVSKILKAGTTPGDPVARYAVAGLVGWERQGAFAAFCRGGITVPDARDLITDYKTHRPSVRAWTENGQTDVLGQLVFDLKTFLQDPDNYGEVARHAASWRNFNALLGDVPPDLKRDLLSHLESLGHNALPV